MGTGKDTREVIRDEIDLAWALALAVKPQLNVGEHNYIFVTIGAGDTFAAIRALLKWVVLKRIPVAPDLALRCASWLDAYAGHEDEKYLRRLIDGQPVANNTTTSRLAALTSV